MKLENPFLVVFIDEKRLGLISVKDKRTGKLWKGQQIPFIIWFWNSLRQEVISQPVWDPNCVDVTYKQTDVDKVSIGYTIYNNFYASERTKTIFYLEVSLNENYLQFRLPTQDIAEEKGNYLKLIGLEIMPGFGGVPDGAKGYMVLPIWGGVVRYFDHEHRILLEPTRKEILRSPTSLLPSFATETFFHYDKSGPRQQKLGIYDDTYHVSLPLFGLVHNNSGYGAFITSGQHDAEIVVKANQGEKKLSSVHFMFYYRRDSKDVINPTDRTVRYCFFAKHQANYCEMAKMYREYLINEKKVTSLKSLMKKNTLVKYFHNVFMLTILFGHKRIQANGRGYLQKFLSYSEAEKLLVRMNEAGMDKVNIRLAGWNRQGHDGMYPTVFPIETKFGRIKEFKKLLEQAKKLGYRIAVHINYGDCYKGSPEWDPEFVMKNKDGTLRGGPIWAGGQSYKACPQAMLGRFVKRDLPKLKSLGLNGAIYFDVVLLTPFCCYDKKHPLTRKGYCLAVKKYLNYAKSLFGAVQTEYGISELLGTVNYLSYVPAYDWKPVSTWAHTTELYQKGLAHKGIPLDCIVYHGIIQYSLTNTSSPDEEEARLEFLHALETGALPKDEWRDNNPRTRIPNEASQYQVICKKLGHLQFEFIEDHKELAPQVFGTKYSDGTWVVVNYSNKKATVLGKRIGPKGFISFKI
ncbi:MAG: DUF5696 domain-containing protein [Candidatus Omnitrophota bacterium]